MSTKPFFLRGGHELELSTPSTVDAIVRRTGSVSLRHVRLLSSPLLLNSPAVQHPANPLVEYVSQVSQGQNSAVKGRRALEVPRALLRRVIQLSLPSTGYDKT